MCIRDSPCFLLERKYISDREGLKELTVAGSSGVKERLTHLCNLAYPGSLEEILETINWVDVPNVKGWTMERFEVLHDPEVDPHGWMMTNDEGWSMIHSGDSGPFEDLWERIGRCSFAVVEMGVPEWVNTEHHHKPSDIIKLANKYPNTKMVITHTFIDSDYQIITKEVPDLPPNVIHGEDGMEFEINSDGQVL